MSEGLRLFRTCGGLPSNLAGKRRDLLKRYGLAFALADIALLLRKWLPVREGTTVYQLPLVAVAIEAMSAIQDRPRLLTIASARRSSADAVLVEVRDSGTGLESAGAEQVFNAFYTTKPDGIGIGLSISRSIVEAHGGRLWASRNEPHGAVFQLSLPVTEEGQP